MSWVFLAIAIVCEIVGTISLKCNAEFSQRIYLLGSATGYPLAFVFLSLALKEIEVSIAYAIWSGIGVVGTLILGNLLFRESISVEKVICMALIITGIVGLQLATKS